MTFTVSGDPAGEARVAADLARIVDRCRTAAADAGDPLRGIVLLGGYARGEGTTVRAADGTPRGFNDYDLLLVLDRPAGDPGLYARLGSELAREVEIDFVDLGLATPAQLGAPPATLFAHELGEAHRVLWERAPGVVTVPRVPLDSLEIAEASRLLGNRGMALVWAGLRLWPSGEPGVGEAAPSASDRGFCVTASHKAVLAAGDATLLLAGRYHLSQDERRRRIAASPPPAPWIDDAFRAAYAAGVDYRRAPDAAVVPDAGALWTVARRWHEIAFSAAESRRLGASFDDWTEHAALARAHAARARRGSAVRRAVRRVLGRPDGPDPDAFLAVLPALLYGERDGDVATHRRRLEGAVHAWHP